MQRAWTLACALAAIAGCMAPLDGRAVTHTGGNVVVVADSASYAAMDELPVTGGELRLVEELEIVVDIDVDGDGVGREPARAIGFPLRRTDISADVSSGIAVTTVEQVFDNPYEAPIEAVYVFPLGAEAAVVAYEIAIGDRTVAGEIQTRDQARRTYENAREAGHTAALLEQQKPNVFSQRVANIPPGQQVRVRFQYVEMLGYADGRYELAVPTVVGPRYLPAERVGSSPVGAHRAGGTGRPGVTSIPYDRSSPSVVSFRASIDAGMPIGEVTSPSHDLAVDRISGTVVSAALADGDVAPDRDIVLRYVAAGERTLVGLATHRDGAGAGYFTLVVQPKQSYGTGDIVPREVILLVDVSGSMDGEPIRQAQAVARAIVGTLGDRDVFNVISFANGTDTMSQQPIRGDEPGRRRGIDWIDRLGAGGGTEMEQGVLASLAAQPGGDRLRVIYLLSDGFVGNDDVILEAADKALGRSRIFPVGVGSAPNRYLIDRLAEVGRGSASYIGLGESAAPVATELVRRSAYPYLTNVAIDWGDLAVEEVTPAVLPDVHAGMPLIVAGRYRTPGAGPVEVTATAAGRRISIPVEVALPTDVQRPAVRYAWARKRVSELTSAASRRAIGESAVETAVTAIGLENHMVTDYTSFVAVDRTRVVVGGGKTKLIQQPAAVPAGVNIDTAVGPGSEPEQTYTASSSRSYHRSSGGGGGGGGFGGGDVDPLTLAILLLMLPAALALRRSRAR